MLSRLEFGAFLVYSPRGTSEASIRSQQVVLKLKANELIGRPPVPVTEHLARRMREELRGEALADLLSADVTLVPVSRHSLPGRPGPWPGDAIAKALVSRGFGCQVTACLRRVRAVPKAAFSRAGERPTAALHRDSIAADDGRLLTEQVVLVDDVVTTGAQLLGAAWALLDAYPGVQVSGFAAVRTMSGLEMNHLVEPVAGEILLDGGRTLRRP